MLLDPDGTRHRSTFRVFGIALIGVLSLHGMTDVAQLQGIITDRRGRPIAGAYVKGDSALSAWIRADQAGRYRLGSHTEVISFRAVGYRPTTRVIWRDTVTLNIVLEDGKTTEWKLPACRSEADMLPIGAGRSRFKLKISSGFGPPQPYNDVDYSGIMIPYRARGRTGYLRTMEGVYNSDGRPSPFLYTDSISFSERAFTLTLAGDRSTEPRIYSQGLDARGSARDGTHWRWIGTMNGSMVVRYEGVSPAAARVFDRIVDTLCIAR